MDERKVASEILAAVGGPSNVSHLEHCSTRLRFSLVNDDKVDAEKIKKIPGVLGVNQTAQTQVIIGNNVIEVYNELQELLKGQTATAEQGPKPKRKVSAVILDFVISIFQPLIPAIAGGGILKSILMLLNLIGVLDKTTSTYQILTFIGDAPLYFLPILVAITTANKLKVNNLVAVSAIGALLIPGLTTLMAEGTNLFGLPIQTINYAYQVFPAILCTISYAYLEKFFTKISPKVIRNIFCSDDVFSNCCTFNIVGFGPDRLSLWSRFCKCDYGDFCKIRLDCSSGSCSGLAVHGGDRYAQSDDSICHYGIRGNR